MIGEVAQRPERDGLEIAPAGDADLLESIRAIAPHISIGRSRGVLRIGYEQGAALLDHDELRWQADAARAVENRVRVRSAEDAVRRELDEIRALDAEGLRAKLGQSAISRRLDDHQLLNVAMMAIPKGWGACIFDEQGTGKTPTVIAAYDLLVERNLADTMVVVAPKSMVGEWAEEFRRFTGDVYSVAVVAGTREQRVAALGSGADVFVLNYEAVVRFAEDLRLLALRSRVVLAVDESFYVKNPDANRTAALSDLREWCARCFVLCGTPAPNRPRDLLAQVGLVDFGLTFEGIAPSEDPAVEREEFKVALGRGAALSRNRKSEVLSLPERRISEIPVQFAPQQGEIYSEALDSLIEDVEAIGESEFAKMRLGVAARRSALLRICSHPAGVVSGYGEIPGKTRVLDRLLDKLTEKGEKVVVWSYYRATLEILARRLERYGLARIDGSVTEEAERRDAVRRFQEDDETMVFLGNPAAAGAGLNLHRAAVAVYESISNQSAHFSQSLDRVHRRGQEREVECLVLLCEGSVEQTEYGNVLRKVERQAEVMGDPPAPAPSRSSVLAELLRSRDSLRR